MEDTATKSFLAPLPKQFRQNYKLLDVKRGRKLTGQHGEYEFIFEVEPNLGDEKLFTLLALAYDVKGKFGFTLIVHNKLFDMLRFI